MHLSHLTFCVTMFHRVCYITQARYSFDLTIFHLTAKFPSLFLKLAFGFKLGITHGCSISLAVLNVMIRVRDLVAASCYQSH